MKRTWFTCQNHPELRWSVGTDEGDQIQFEGQTRDEMLPGNIAVDCATQNEDGSMIEECPCEPDCLIVAPENDQIEDDGDDDQPQTE